MQQRFWGGHHAPNQVIDPGLPFRTDAGIAEGRRYHTVISCTEVARCTSLDRRLIAVRVQHQEPGGRILNSFVVGACRREPLTTTERSAFLLLFPCAPDGTYRDALEPMPIRLKGYDYSWYWCAHIVAAGRDNDTPASLNVSSFLARTSAFERYLAVGETQQLLALMAQELAYKGYFST